MLPILLNIAISVGSTVTWPPLRDYPTDIAGNQFDIHRYRGFRCNANTPAL